MPTTNRVIRALHFFFQVQVEEGVVLGDPCGFVESGAVFAEVLATLHALDSAHACWRLPRSLAYVTLDLLTRLLLHNHICETCKGWTISKS